MIVVTGLLRSGTSAVAERLVRMGVVMGDRMAFPVGVLRPEWEDADLSIFLARGPDPQRAREFLEEYVCRRGQQLRGWTSHGCSVHREWGVKSPYLLPYLGVLRSLGEPVRLIVTRRSIMESDASLRRCAESMGDLQGAFLDFSLDAQRTLVRFLPEALREADLVIDFKSISESQQVMEQEIRACLA